MHGLLHGGSDRLRGSVRWTRWARWAIGAWLAFAAVACQESSGVQRVQVVTGDWAPFTDRHAPDRGRSAALLTAALGEMGRVPEYVFLPWGEATRLASRSESNAGIRGIFPLYGTPERREQFHFSRPLQHVSMALFFDADKTPALLDAAEPADLAGQAVLLVEGYEYPDEIEALSTLPREANEYRAFARLFDPQDPVQAVPAVPEVARALVKAHFPGASPRLRAVPGATKIALHFMASRRNPHNAIFIRELDAAIARLHEAGVMERLAKPSPPKAAGDTVALTPAPHGDGGVWAQDCSAAGGAFRLPRGSLGRVLTWSRTLAAGEDAAGVAATRVRLLNGPRRGQTVCVEDAYVELSSP
jgi:hypothetical protein